MMMNSIPTFGVRTGSEYSWYTYRMANNYLTICPGQIQSSGTFYIKVQGYGSYMINAVTLPLRTCSAHEC